MHTMIKIIAPAAQFWLIATVIWTPLAVTAADAVKTFAAGVTI